MSDAIQPFRIEIPQATSTTSTTGSPTPAGPVNCPASNGPAEYRWGTCKSSPSTGVPGTTGASRRRG